MSFWRVIYVHGGTSEEEQLRKALSSFPGPVRFTAVRDGALPRLLDCSDASDVPDLVLQELQEPLAGSLAAAALIKQSPAWRPCPLIAIVSPELRQELARIYELGVNCCIERSANVEQFLEVIRATLYFWLRIAERPRRSPWASLLPTW